MARLTETNKSRLIADISTNQFSVRELGKKYGVSNATVQKYKDDADMQSEQVVNAGIAYKTGLAAIGDSVKVNAIVNAVDERTQHLIFFANAAVRNVQEAMAAPCENQADYQRRADTISKGKDASLGKSPDTAIQINNSAPQVKTINDFYSNT
jgi:hypothetical protein